MGRGRLPARADRGLQPRGELLAGGPDRAVRPVLGALLRPRPRATARRTTSPARRTSASSSTGTSSSCSSTRTRSTRSRRCRRRTSTPGSGSPAWRRSSRTSGSVYETDQFWPLIELGQELSGKRYGETFEVDRALRILADHTRGTSFLVADGVVPSNEDRGYVLRRLMRRAILQGRRIGIEPGFMPRFAQVVRDLMGAAYPELIEQADTIDMWLAREEEAFGQTLEQGTRILEDHVARAKAAGAEGIGAAEAFQLHDTYGFPFDLTLELAAEQGLGVDSQGFEDLMEEQRTRARASTGRGGRDEDRERARVFADAAGFDTTFTGYETVEQTTAVGAVDRRRTAGCSSSSSSRRSTPPAAARSTTPARSAASPATAPPASPTCCGSATTRCWCSSRSRASCTRASAWSRSSTAPRAAPPSATTPPRTSCTRRCASASARTCARPAPTSGPTSCASTSPTARRCRRRTSPGSRTASTSGSSPTSPCARSPPRSTRPAASARWRCSARSTATSCAWSRSATARGRASCAAAPTCARPPRSAPSS